MHGITIVAVDHGVVLEVLVGDQLLVVGMTTKCRPESSGTYMGSDDVHAVLAAGVDTEVVGDLHAGDLGVISEDPVDAVLQETHQVGVAVADTATSSLFSLVFRPARTRSKYSRLSFIQSVMLLVKPLVGQSIELAADDQALTVQEGHGHRAGIGLSIEAVVQEVTDLEVLQLSQGTAHHIDVISDDIDVLSHQGVSSVFDGDRRIQMRAGLGHHELDGLDPADGGQRTLIPTVGNLAAQGNMSHLAVLRQHGHSTLDKVDAAEQLVGNGLGHIAVDIGFLVLDITLGPLLEWSRRSGCW